MGLDKFQGTVIEGTLRAEDLIPRFVDVLSDLLEAQAFEKGADAPNMVQAQANTQALLGALERDMESPGFYDDNERTDNAVEFLFDALDAHAPRGFTFGAHEGDGADFGFWPLEDVSDNQGREDDGMP